ncbi:MAG: DUF2167 domain-containing protein [Maricaulaceae bacterium]
MSLFKSFLQRSGIISLTVASLYLSAQTASFAQDTDSAIEAAEFTPLTPEEIQTLFSHPQLQNNAPSEYTAEELASIKTYLDESDAFFATLSPKTGEVSVDRVGVTLDLGEDYYFLGKKDARRILEDRWNNPEDESLQGMIFAKGSNQDFYDYAIEVNFEKTGYVSDEDAGNIDYDEMLRDITKSSNESNPARKKLGFPSITVKGWAADPKYDAENHRLYWAKLIHFEGEESNTLNYNLRLLGRKGVLQFNFIADENALAIVDNDINDVAKIASFNDGHKYTDFNPATDDVAAYGVAGLIAGGVVAKKLGALGVLLLFLKKGWVIILAAFAFLGRFFKRDKGSA